MDYPDCYRGVDFREEPEKYLIGRGEQGVLLAEPYKSEILPHWRFRTLPIARKSSSKILEMFYAYLDEDDFVGADMARKFLMMGWTRARRYANHQSGRKYDEVGNVIEQDPAALSSEKALAAATFKQAYDEARNDVKYKRLYEEWRASERLFFGS